MWVGVVRGGITRRWANLSVSKWFDTTWGCSYADGWLWLELLRDVIELLKPMRKPERNPRWMKLANAGSGWAIKRASRAGRYSGVDGVGVAGSSLSGVPSRARRSFV